MKCWGSQALKAVDRLGPQAMRVLHLLQLRGAQALTIIYVSQLLEAQALKANNIFQYWGSQALKAFNEVDFVAPSSESIIFHCNAGTLYLWKSYISSHVETLKL